MHPLSIYINQYTKYKHISPSSEMEDGWMYVVDNGENEVPTILKESEVARVNEKTNLDGLCMESWCFCDVKPKDLIQNLPKMCGRPKIVLLIVTTNHNLGTRTSNQDIPGLMSQLHYKVKTTYERSDDLAEKVMELLVRAGAKNVRKETLVKRAECGTQSTPDVYNYISDITVCQLSVQSKRDATFHYKLGRALSPLKHDNVVILGLSNNTGLAHLQTSCPPHIWAEAFDKWLNYCLLNKRFEEIIQFEKRYPHASNVHWVAERLYPLLVALGAAGEGAIVERLHEGWSFSSHS